MWLQLKYTHATQHIQGGPKLMVQTLRVGTGLCNTHLLYRNAWAQVTRWDANKEKNRRKERQSFIESVVEKSNAYNNCSKFRPSALIHTLVEWLSYTFKDARYFMHMFSSFGYVSNEILSLVKWSFKNKILHISP